ncbi:MAG: MFS transporter [Verrucomicrobiota bacterium]
MPIFPRNVWVLFVCQALTTCSAPVMIMVSGLLGLHLAPSETLATLPQAFTVIGLASATIPAALLMRRIGRKRGTYVGLSLALAGALLGAGAATWGSFPLLVAAGFLLGTNLAFTQQYRFAVMESVPSRADHGPAISLLLMGGIVAAWLGPEVGAQGRDLMASPHGYAGSFLLLACLIAVAMGVFALFRNPRVAMVEAQLPARPLAVVLRAPVFIVAVGAGAISYAVMSFIMTATPISMHAMQGHSLEHTKFVIQSHIAAMYLPSLIGGWLLRRVGIARLLVVGALIYIAMLVLGLRGHAVLHYWWALVLLGVGWNFLFVGGTALLPSAYRTSERFKVQAANDFLIFGAQAVATLSAGGVLVLFGWEGLILFSLAPVGIVTGLVLWYWRHGAVPMARA